MKLCTEGRDALIKSGSVAEPSPPAANAPDHEWCRISQGAGSFMLQVTSAAVHDFSVCDEGKVVDTDIDQVLDQPGWDLRCRNELTGNDRYNAAIGLYSSGKKADKMAAKAYCSAQRWKPDH